jgi:hypothetical protein
MRRLPPGSLNARAQGRRVVQTRGTRGSEETKGKRQKAKIKRQNKDIFFLMSLVPDSSLLPFDFCLLPFAFLILLTPVVEQLCAFASLRLCVK